jgi:hypothetical protein
MTEPKAKTPRSERNDVSVLRRILTLTLAPWALSACCAWRERDVRAEVEPYIQAIDVHYAATGSCPKDLSGIRAADEDAQLVTPTELELDGVQVRYFAEGGCRLTYSLGFCGICHYLWPHAPDAGRWECHH